MKKMFDVLLNTPEGRRALQGIPEEAKALLVAAAPILERIAVLTAKCRTETLSQQEWTELGSVIEQYKPIVNRIREMV